MLINDSGSALKQKANFKLLCEPLKIIFCQSSATTTTRKKKLHFFSSVYTSFWGKTGKGNFCIHLEVHLLSQAQHWAKVIICLLVWLYFFLHSSKHRQNDACYVSTSPLKGKFVKDPWI